MSTLDEIEARLQAATPGPWSMQNVRRMPDGFPGHYADIEPMIAGGVDPADGELIAHAPARVGVTTFASNIGRIRAVAEAAAAAERNVVVMGRAMRRAIERIEKDGHVAGHPRMIRIERL